MNLFAWNGYRVQSAWQLRGLVRCVQEDSTDTIHIHTSLPSPSEPLPPNNFGRCFDVEERDDETHVVVGGQTISRVDVSRRRIDIKCGEYLRPREIEDFLQRVALPLYAAWDGQVVVHGVGVRREDGGTSLFLGNSGSGKSTAAARIISAGGELVADDILVLHAVGEDVVLRTAGSLLRSRDALDFECVGTNDAGKRLYRVPVVAPDTPCRVDRATYAEEGTAPGQWLAWPKETKAAFGLLAGFAMYWSASTGAQRRQILERVAKLATLLTPKD